KEPLGSILNAGSVRMFQKSGNQWSEFTKFSMGDVQADDNLSAVSLSGSTLALGSAYNNGEGAVYIYRWNGSAWTFSQKLTYPLSDSAPQFGLSLSLSGAILAVGAPSYSAGGDAAFDRSGAAFVFRDNGSTFSLDSTVTLGAGNTNKGFGSSVSVSGNFLAVGAPQAITKESLGAGTVYVYQLAAGSATLTKTLTAPNGATGERFGDSVSLLGSSLAVGAPLYQKDANVKAGAFFYWANYLTSTATQVLDDEMYANTGAAVQLTPTHLYVSSPGATVSDGALAGCVNRYKLSDLENTALKDKPIDFRLFSTNLMPSDFFGAGLSVSGNTVFVGARNKASPNNGAGAVYMFEAK
ncbi:MAG: hypothetical protein AB7O96_15445, partial [Pseudobdellovibrionaceae bacterium]